MECHEVDDLIMQYMDGGVDESEAAKLREHLLVCPQCAADFNMYDNILTGFSEIKLLPAPEGFEERVMRRVMELPSTIENMICLVWGGVSVLFGIGCIMAINRNAIIDYLYSYPQFAGYSSVLKLINGYSTGLTLTINQITTSTAQYVSVLRYALLAILAVLAAAQIALYRRSY